jgi:hypothetical protein
MDETPDQATSSENIKRLTLLPFRVTVEFQSGAALTQWLPWQAPVFMGVAGEPKGQAGHRAAVVGFEWPTQQFVPTSGFDQRQLERLHLDRFLTDCSLLWGQIPFHHAKATEPNADPQISQSKPQRERKD